MSLPVINTPTYELEIPSTKETLIYRPFLVKEEKILLMAMEEDNDKTTIRAIRQIVKNCTFEKFDIDNLPMFDLEYIFLNIRAKSVGEVATIRLLSPDDGKTYVEVQIPLEEVKVKFNKKHKKVVKLTDDISIEMSYPNLEVMTKLNENAKTNEVFNIIGDCVERIIDGETIYERTDFTKKDLSTFLDSLNTKQFQDVQTFFETMPKLTYDVEFENPKTKKMNKVTLEGMQSFFG